MNELDFDEPDVKQGAEERWRGVYDGLDFAAYLKAPGVNNSFLKNFHLSPLQAITEKQHPHPDTRPTKVGHAFHCLVAEPEIFEKLYIRAAYPEFRTKKAKEWKAAVEAEGKFVLRTTTEGDSKFWSPPEWEMIHRMRDAVMADPYASALLDGPFERSIFWIDRTKNGVKGTGKLCKARMDLYNAGHEAIIDLKSCVDASYSGFQRSINEFEYFRQVGWYLDGCNSPDVNMLAKHFFFVAAEKQPPYQVKVYRMDNNHPWCKEGRSIYQRDMEHYAVCHKHDIWPSYGERLIELPDGTTEIVNGGIRDIEQPGYAKYHGIS